MPVGVGAPPWGGALARASPTPRCPRSSEYTRVRPPRCRLSAAVNCRAGEVQHGGRPARIHRRSVEHGVLGIAAREPCEPRPQQPERKLAARARGAVEDLERGVHAVRGARNHPQQARPAATDGEAMPAGVRLDDLGAGVVQLAASREGHELRADGGGRRHHDGTVIERLVDAGSVRHRQRTRPAPLPHAQKAVVCLHQHLAAGGDLSEDHAGPEAILGALVDALRPRRTHSLPVQAALDAWHVPLGIAAIRRRPLPQPEAQRRAHEAGAVLRGAPNADGRRAARVRQLGPAQAGEQQRTGERNTKWHPHSMHRAPLEHHSARSTMFATTGW